MSKWSSHHNPRCLRNLQYTRSARKAEDSAVRSQMVKLICGPKSVDGGSRETKSALLVVFLVAVTMSTVSLRKAVPL